MVICFVVNFWLIICKISNNFSGVFYFKMALIEYIFLLYLRPKEKLLSVILNHLDIWVILYHHCDLILNCQIKNHNHYRLYIHLIVFFFKIDFFTNNSKNISEILLQNFCEAEAAVFCVRSFRIKYLCTFRIIVHM